MRLIYRDSTGTEHAMDGEFVWSGIGAELRSSKWSYKLGAKRVTGLTRNAREVDVDCQALSIAELDTLRRAFERDVVRESAGTFVVDGWEQRAYILEASLESIYEHADTAQAKFTAVLLEGAWRYPHTKSFTHDAEIANEWLDYPYDYPHDYGIGVVPTEITNQAIADSPVILTIYGAATNPYVTIGDNRYQVNVAVPLGGYLVINGVAHTITLFDSYGNPQSVFDAGVRGTGAGSGTYVFETLKAGTSSVSWPAGFGFDITYYSIEGAPPWSR